MKNLRTNWLYWLYLVGFGVFFGRVWSLALFWDEMGLRSGWIASWADGAAHLSYMSTFAFRDSFPLTHPLFMGKVFSYPYVADLLGGYLVKMGLPLHFAYNFLGFLFSMFFVVMVWKLFETLFKNKNVSFVGSLIFFLGAGLTGLENIAGGQYKHIFDTYDWVDIISAQIMPQRALILGMPLGIWIFITIYNYFSTKKGVSDYDTKLFFAGLITGLMSIIHTHTLIALFFLVGWMFVLDVKKNKYIRRGWWWYGLPAVILSGAMLIRQLGSFDGSFFRYLPLWLVKSKNENLIWFWIKSWGIWPVIAFVGFSKIKKAKKILLFPLLLLFILLNIFSFQPHDWDNTKLFLWVYLFLSGVAGLGLLRIWNKKRWLAILCFGLMTFSGIIDARRLLTPQIDPMLHLLTHEDERLANEIRRNTSKNSIFVTSNYHLNPIPVLTGRQILMGYPGWLWTYGIDYSKRLEEVELIYVGGKKAENLIDKYRVSYVVFDDVVLGSMKGANEGYYVNNYLVKFENSRYRVYEVRNN